MAGAPVGYDHGDVMVGGGLLTTPVEAAAGRCDRMVHVPPPPRDVTSAGTCGLANGAGERPPEASRKPINLGMARFIGDTVDALAVKFTALSTPDDNKDSV